MLHFFNNIWLPVSEPITGARPVPPGALGDVGSEAPHVHPAVRSPSITHGTERLPWWPHARTRFPPDAWPDGSTARFPNDANAGPARPQAYWSRPQPAQHTTTAAPAPASVTAGAHESRLSWHCWKYSCSLILDSTITSLFRIEHTDRNCVFYPWGWHFSSFDDNIGTFKSTCHALGFQWTLA